MLAVVKADFVVDYLPEGSLSVAFPYDIQAIELIKAIPGRRWNKERRFWIIPRTSLRPLQQQAGRLGYGIALSETVRQALNMGKERAVELNAAKTNESPFLLPTTTEPRPFQYAGIRFGKYALHNFKGALVADDMGLGKTFQALSLVALHDRLKQVLVLCPATLKYTWAAEIDRHYPQLTYTVIDGGWDLRQAQWQEDTRIKIVNYELLVPKHSRECPASSREKRKEKHRCQCSGPTKDVDLRLIHWDLVIADEITALKSYKSIRTQLAKKLHRRYALGLSGTPIENSLDELHSIMDFVIPGLLGPGWLFHQQHAVKDFRGNIKGWQGINEVKQRIAPYYIRRTKRQVLKELPGKFYNDVPLEMSNAEWELYDVIKAQIKEKIADNPKLNAVNIMVEMVRLKQMTCDSRLVDEANIPSTKLKAAKDILEASGNEHKVVFFTQFAQYARILAEEFEAPLIEGDVPPKKRQEIIESFQAGNHPCLVSTDAGAYGITLTAADIIVHMDRLWNPMKMRQREDRLDRLGQTQPVQVVTLTCRKTIDELIVGKLWKKLDLIKSVLDEDNPEEDTISVSKTDLLELLA